MLPLCLIRSSTVRRSWSEVGPVGEGTWLHHASPPQAGCAPLFIIRSLVRVVPINLYALSQARAMASCSLRRFAKQKYFKNLQLLPFGHTPAHYMDAGARCKPAGSPTSRLPSWGMLSRRLAGEHGQCVVCQWPAAAGHATHEGGHKAGALPGPRGVVRRTTTLSCGTAGTRQQSIRKTPCLLKVQ